MHFTDQLIQKVNETSPIILGVDPNFDLMPEFLVPKSSSETAVEDSLTVFSQLSIEATKDLVPAVKFQSAYFEQFGTPGIRALSTAIQLAKEAGLLIIMDGKRGDIGSTSLAYAQAYLKGVTTLSNGLELPSDLAVDCLTISPFLGEDSLRPFVDVAIEEGKGLFLLVKTSNPGSGAFLDRMIDGEPMHHRLARLVETLNEGAIGESGYGLVGAVLGGTIGSLAKDLRDLMPSAMILMPGLGAQGGESSTVKSVMDENGGGCVVPISRGITYLKDKSLDKDQYLEGIKANTERFVTLLRDK